MSEVVFAAYLEQVFGPILMPSDAVVLANLPAHQVTELAKSVKDRGACLLCLSPYSPNLNPIKLASSKFRTGLRTANRPAPTKRWMPPFRPPQTG